MVVVAALSAVAAIVEIVLVSLILPALSVATAMGFLIIVSFLYRLDDLAESRFSC